jgi:hypothetical protein
MPHSAEPRPQPVEGSSFSEISTTNSNIYSHLPHSTPKKPNKKLSSPQASGKQANPIKTKEKKVKNNWHTSFTQFDKIELTKKSRQARLPSRAFAFNRNTKEGGPNLTPIF